MKRKIYFSLFFFLNVALWGGFTVINFAPFRGDYYSQGVLLLPDGNVKSMKVSTAVDNDEVYEVVNLEGHYLEFHRNIYSRFWKSYRVYNVSGGPDQSKTQLYGDDRLVFNYLYSSRKGTRLTVHNVTDSGAGSCFYIVELRKLRCMKHQ